MYMWYLFYTDDTYRLVSKSPLSLCDNTCFCNSLHKLLSPCRELMCGWIEREAGSQGKEQKHNKNFVVKRQGRMGSV